MENKKEYANVLHELLAVLHNK